MDNPEVSSRSSKHRRWPWLLLLAALAVGAFLLLKPVKGSREASITTTGVKPESGHSVTVPIVINTAGKTINAAQIFLKFDPKLVQVQSMNKDGSFFTLWVKDQPAFSNSTGDISFAGGVTNPGFTGQGNVGSVTLTANKALKTQLTFEPNTTVLLNDGLGTAIPLHLKPIEVSIP